MKKGSLCSTWNRSFSFDRVNPEELAKFATVGSDWWDTTSKSGTGPLHAMNPVRVGFIRQQIAQRFKRQNLFESKQIQGLDILDVGCGGGILAEALARLGANVTAIDPSAENISVARSHSSRDPLTATINYEQSTIEQVADSGRKFHAVCALEVIEHVDDPRGFLRACSRCLLNSNSASATTSSTSQGTSSTNTSSDENEGFPAVGGSLFVSTMNRTKQSYAMAILGAEYVLQMVPPGTHDWDKFIRPEELQSMVEVSHNEEQSMQMQSVKGMVLYPPKGALPSPRITQDWWSLSDSDTKVNYIAHFTKS